MKNRNFVNAFMLITMAVVLGFGATAFAGPGMGYGRGGYGPGMMGDGPGMGRGSGYPGDLNDEDIKKLDEQRNAFFESTKNLRNDLYEKRVELGSEMAKQSPDSQKAGNLQKEISELRTQLDQKRIDHMIEIKKINPNVGRGFAGRGPGGNGAGFGGGACRR